MLYKVKNALISERIPGIVCAMACITSVILGFTIGHIVSGSGENLLAYDDAAAVYQPGTPYLAAMPEFDDLPMIGQAPTPEYDNPVMDSPVAAHLYVVTILGEYIAIYHAEEYGGGLKEVTSTSVGALAPEEIERLATGIKIYSDEALAMILQDYGS